MSMAPHSQRMGDADVSRPAPAPRRVVHISRRAFSGQHSIELVFQEVRNAWSRPEFEILTETAPNFSRGLWSRLQNCRWAARLRGDLFHITGDIHYVALALDGRRTILTVHDCFALARLHGVRRAILKRYWFDLPAARVAAITVVSEETKRQLERWAPTAKGKIVVIPNAVSPIFQPNARETLSSRPRILQIGTAPNKNLARMFDALKGIDCELCIVGKLGEDDRQRLLASGIPYTCEENLSEVEIYRCYCQADIVSFPSTYEGFGLPIIEAQWVERPVVTSNCSSMPEVAGGAACMVDPFDVASIRNGFLKVIEDQEFRKSLVAAGRRNRERFSYQTVADQYATLYEQVLNP